MATIKRFGIIFICIFLQVSFLIVGLTEIQEGQTLLSPEINAAFLGSITAISNQYATIENSLNQLSPQGIITTQIFKICIPAVNPAAVFGGNFFTEVCTPALPVINIGNLINYSISIATILFNLGIAVFSMLVQAIVFAGAFYTAILLTLLPKGVINTAFATTIGLILGTLQSMYILYQFIVSFEEISALTFKLRWNAKD